MHQDTEEWLSAEQRPVLPRPISCPSPFHLPSPPHPPKSFPPPSLLPKDFLPEMDVVHPRLRQKVDFFPTPGHYPVKTSAMAQTLPVLVLLLNEIKYVSRRQFFVNGLHSRRLHWKVQCSLSHRRRSKFLNPCPCHVPNVFP